LLNDNPDLFLLPNKEKVTSWTYIAKIGLVIKKTSAILLVLATFNRALMFNVTGYTAGIQD
jgi:hypothetical protein